MRQRSIAVYKFTPCIFSLYLFQSPINISMYNRTLRMVVDNPTIILFTFNFIAYIFSFGDNRSKTVISFVNFMLQICLIIQMSNYLFSVMFVLLAVKCQVGSCPSLFQICIFCYFRLVVEIKICKVLDRLRCLSLKHRLTSSQHMFAALYFLLCLQPIRCLLGDQHIMIRQFRIKCPREVITIISELIASLYLFV